MSRNEFPGVGSTQNRVSGSLRRSAGWFPFGSFRYLAGLFAFLFLVTVGVWGYVTITQTIRHMRSAELRAIAEAECRALRVWVRELTAETTRWAADPRVLAAVSNLSRRSAGCGSRAHDELIDFLEARWRARGGTIVNAVAPTGVILASSVPEYCGQSLNEREFLPDLADVFAGRPKFIRPYAESGRLRDSSHAELKGLTVWIEVPVKDSSGNVIAALGFGEYAHLRFGRIVGVTKIGESGESFAFDDDALLLSDLPDPSGLHHAGMLSSDETSSMLRIRVLDPGGDLLAGYKAPSASAEWPKTRLMEVATASAARPAAGDTGGELLDPYRSHVGRSVIGAWRWLPELNMGIAVEMSEAEAYAASKQLLTVFVVVYGVLITALVGAGLSSLTLLKVWRELSGRRLLGPYRIEKLIGQGGKANVYLAHHSLLKRPTALKILKPNKNTAEDVERFVREVTYSAQLDHPNTVEIYDYGVTRDGIFYVAMELLRGLTLEELVAVSGPLPEERAVFLLKHICGSLAEVHARGLIHRDIKPQNVMACVRGGMHDVVKVLDFGLVKHLEPSAEVNLTRTMDILGTPAYLSPERIRNPAGADVRSDIYAVGAVGYFLVAGRPVFEEGSDQGILELIRHAPVAPPSQFSPHALTGSFEELLLQCLEKRPEKRPSSIKEVLERLEALEPTASWTEADAKRWWGAHPDAFVFCRGIHAPGEQPLQPSGRTGSASSVCPPTR